MSELLLLDRAGRRRSPADARLLHRPTAAEQGLPLSRRSSEDRADHRRHAYGRRRRAWATPAWLDRRPVARLAAYPASAGARRRRARSRARRVARASARADGAAKSAWTRGAGTSSSHGSSYESSFPSALCPVSSTPGRVVARGRVPAPEPSCGARGGRSGHPATVRSTSAPARSRRRNGPPRRTASSSSSASSATATSASPRSTSKASTTPRSSTRSTPATRP